jgi:hypothetical protein
MLFLQACCGQFMVHREMIRSLPREAYQHWYNMIMTDYSNSERFWAFGFEYTWHIIFGEPTRPVHEKILLDKGRFNAIPYYFRWVNAEAADVTRTTEVKLELEPLPNLSITEST